MTKVVDNFDSVIKRIKNQISDDKIKRRVVNRLASYELAKIVFRTQEKGLDYLNRPFIPYSAGYKKRSKKVADHVTLKDKGHMFNSLAYRSIGNGAELYFRQYQQNKKAYYHDMGIGRLPKRPFFRLSKPEKDILLSTFSKEYAKELKSVIR